MARPTYPDPVAPTLESPLYGAPDGARCGDTFMEDIDVRRPYGETDVFVRPVPRLWHMVLDISRAFPSLEQRIADGISETTTELDAYGRSREVDQANFDAIDEILDLASEYLDYSSDLREHWKDPVLEYVDSGGIDAAEARSWLILPLMAEAPPALVLCREKPPEEVVRLELPEGAWVDFRCPGLGIAAIYAEDWDRYKETLVKAAQQARCGQEALYSLVAYNVNRRKAEEGPVGPPRPVKPGEILEAPPPKPTVPPPVVPTTPILPPPPEPGWSTGKKVAVAAVAIGVAGGIFWLMTRTKEPRSARAAGTM